MLLNIDLGERGADHATDHALAAHADLINLACSGHAGDAASVSVFTALAAQYGATPTPSTSAAGRWRSPSTTWCSRSTPKGHCCPVSTTSSCTGRCTTPRTPTPRSPARWPGEPGALAHAARERGLAVLAEAFADRRYTQTPGGGGPALLPRRHPAASLTALPDALAQARRLIADQSVVLFPDGPAQVIRADTLCVHSDNPVALDLAAAVAAQLRKGRAT